MGPDKIKRFNENKAQIFVFCKFSKEANKDEDWKTATKDVESEHFKVYRMDVEEDFEKEEKDFEMPGLPYAVLVGINGLIAWKGHAKRRVFEEDLIELRKEHMLFQTEDYHDDPDKPFKDPDESEMQKDFEVQKRKPKGVEAVLKEVEKKMKFFCEKL